MSRQSGVTSRISYYAREVGSTHIRYAGQTKIAFVDHRRAKRTGLSHAIFILFRLFCSERSLRRPPFKEFNGVLRSRVPECRWRAVVGFLVDCGCAAPRGCRRFTTRSPGEECIFCISSLNHSQIHTHSQKSYKGQGAPSSRTQPRSASLQWQSLRGRPRGCERATALMAGSSFFQTWQTCHHGQTREIAQAKSPPSPRAERCQNSHLNTQNSNRRESPCEKTRGWRTVLVGSLKVMVVTRISLE